jgi:hypothetical protein
MPIVTGLSVSIRLRNRTEENKRFEVVLIQNWTAADRWDRVAAAMPSRSMEALRARFAALEVTECFSIRMQP